MCSELQSLRSKSETPALANSIASSIVSTYIDVINLVFELIDLRNFRSELLEIKIVCGFNLSIISSAVSILFLKCK